MDANEAYEALRNSPDLPSPTGVALRVLELAGSADCDIRSLTRVIETDPAITGRLLALVNSALFGISRRIGSLSQAVAYLGLRNVRWIALGFSLISRHRGGPCPRFDYDDFWADSLARAVAARNLASFLKISDPNEVFAYGLLSQIGRLAFAHVFPDRYDNLLAILQPVDPAEVLDAERDLFGLDHCELAGRLAADWRLPEAGCAAISQQDRPRLCPEVPAGPVERLPHLLYVAGRIARLLLCPELAQGLPDLIRRLRDLGVPTDVFQHLFDRIGAEWQEAAQIFAVRSRPAPSLAELYQRADELRTALSATSGVAAAEATPDLATVATQPVA